MLMTAVKISKNMAERPFYDLSVGRSFVWYATPVALDCSLESVEE